METPARLVSLPLIPTIFPLPLPAYKISFAPEGKSSTGLSAQKLLGRFIKYKTDVLRFMIDFKVPFNNNGTERDLRMLKLQQKIAGCFRTKEGATIFFRVRSYLSSARKQGYILLTALESALKGKPVTICR